MRRRLLGLRASFLPSVRSLMPLTFVTSRWQRLSIRTRLSVGYVATLSLLLFVYAALVYQNVLDRFKTEIDHRLDQEVEIAERSLAKNATGELVWRPLHDSDVGGYEPLANMLWIDVHRDDGTLIGRSLGGYARGATPEPLPFAQRPSGFFSASPPGGAHLRILQKEVLADGERVAIRAAFEENQIERELASLLWGLALGLPLAVGAAGLTGYWLAGRALAPVARMTGEARAITAERLDARLPVLNPLDELGQLATTFNALFTRIAHSFEQLRRFTADASHELRTPLTVIRSVGEVGLREPHTEAEYRDIIGTMLEEVDRLTLLTSTLLELTRAEGGRLTLHREPIDLRELLTEVVHFLGVLAEEKGVRFVLALPSEAMPVSGDWTVLRQALVNVIDNALRHSPTGAEVEVAGKAAGNRVEIAVTDHGPGIAPEHREQVFERFFRIDASRNSKSGGFGLGLAIARWAVETHGGRIDISDGNGGGCAFHIELPGISTRSE